MALEALRMDISSMLPVRATRRKGTMPKGAPKSPALQVPKKKDLTWFAWGPCSESPVVIHGEKGTWACPSMVGFRWVSCIV